MKNHGKALAILSAAQVLLKRGWVQAYRMTASDASGHVRYCIMGAMREAAGDNNLAHKRLAEDHLLETIRERMGFSDYHISTYNDAPGRTQQDVVRMMGHAIDRITRFYI